MGSASLIFNTYFYGLTTKNFFNTDRWMDDTQAYNLFDWNHRPSSFSRCYYFRNKITIYRACTIHWEAHALGESESSINWFFWVILTWLKDTFSNYCGLLDHFLNQVFSVGAHQLDYQECQIEVGSWIPSNYCNLPVFHTAYELTISFQIVV